MRLRTQGSVSWPKHFLSLVRELSPDYQLNPAARGIRTECLRELRPGLWLSQSTLCKRGGYSHCAGLALTPDLPNPHLYSPFFIGGRFDDNLDIAMASMKHLGISPDERRRRGIRVHSTHQWRPGSDDIVRACTATAESLLVPFYLRRLREAATDVSALLRVASDALDLSDASLAERAAPLGQPNLHLGLFELTDPNHPWQSMPAPQRYYARIVASRDLFVTQRSSLDRMIAALREMSDGA